MLSAFHVSKSFGGICGFARHHSKKFTIQRGSRGSPSRFVEVRCGFEAIEQIASIVRRQPDTGDRRTRAEGREGIQCKFSTGREGATEESEVVIWVGEVLLNAASDFSEAYFHWRTWLSMRTLWNFSPINRLPKETTHGQIPTTATTA